MQNMRIQKAQGDFLYDQDGKVYFDLISGFGTVFFGHCHPKLVEAMREQSQQAWAIARFDSLTRLNCYERIQTILPHPLSLTSVNSTGMESSELAARYAAAKTGKKHFIGFANSMHGKSTFSANLTWSNTLIDCSATTTLDFPNESNQDTVLEILEKQLKTNEIAACFVEPIRGSFDGKGMSNYFLNNLISLCNKYKVLSIFDETLTGLYRTGSLFYVSELDYIPDMLIFAKSIGNGFPISCLASKNEPEVMNKCLPGSTFSENPLALNIANAVIMLLENISAKDLVGQIEDTILSYQTSFTKKNIMLGGKGAMWVLNFDSKEAVEKTLNALFEENILVSRFGNNIRLLPKLQGSQEELKRACAIIGTV